MSPLAETYHPKLNPWSSPLPSKILSTYSISTSVDDNFIRPIIQMPKLEGLCLCPPYLSHQEILLVLLSKCIQNMTNSHYIQFFLDPNTTISPLDYCSSSLAYFQHSQSLLVGSTQWGSSFPDTQFIQLQPHRLPRWSSDTPGMFPPQGLCIHWSSYQEYFSLSIHMANSSTSIKSLPNATFSIKPTLATLFKMTAIPLPIPFFCFVFFLQHLCIVYCLYPDRM